VLTYLRRTVTLTRAVLPAPAGDKK
jgi:hypothetical protein